MPRWLTCISYNWPKSLLVLSWWFAQGSITFLVVSDFGCIITEGSGSNSASIFLCFLHDRTMCVLSVKPRCSPNQGTFICVSTTTFCRCVLVLLDANVPKPQCSLSVFEYSYLHSSISQKETKCPITAWLSSHYLWNTVDVLQTCMLCKESCSTVVFMP